MSKGKSYSGVLSDRIILPDHKRDAKLLGLGGPYVGADRHREIDRRIRCREEQAKLLRLFEHFDVDAGSQDAWQELALALARKHVPGFMIARNTGRPVKITVTSLYSLFMIFRRKARQLPTSVSVTDKRVCDALVKDKTAFVYAPEFQGVSSKRLQNLLQEARKCREEHLLHRWHARQYSRRLADGEVGITGMGDAPYWPVPRHLFAKKSPVKG